MKLKIVWITGCLALLSACSDSKYDLDKLVPKEYNKILYVNNSGKQELVLYDTEEDNKYTLSVVKSGSQPEQSATAGIFVLTTQLLEDEYSNPEGVNYKIISDNSYSLETTRLDFSTTERYKTVEISLKPQQIKASMEAEPTAVWVLPLYVGSDTDSVNVEKKDLFLLMKTVVTPSLGFVDSSISLKTYNYETVSTISENIAISLDIENKWDIAWEFEIDEEYIATYNAKNDTYFKVLPQNTYSIPESMDLSNGVTKTELTAIINGDQLMPGDYMLPIRIKNISQFDISSTNAVYPFAIRILGPQLTRTDWTAEANTEEAGGEGVGNGVATCVLDNNLETYWHSRWSGWSDGLPHELIIDAKKEYTFTQFAMLQRQHANFTDVGTGEFYVSSDKEEWIKVGDFIMQKILDRQVFAINPAKGRYFKIKITESYRPPYSSLSEVYAYGLE